MNFFFESEEQGGCCFHPKKKLVLVWVLLLSVFAVREQRGFGLVNISTFYFIPAFPFGSEGREGNFMESRGKALREVEKV